MGIENLIPHIASLIVSLHSENERWDCISRHFSHNRFSPKSASAKVSNRVVPDMGHLGVTQVNGLRKANPKQSLPGKSATLELGGTLATQRRKRSSAGSSNKSKSLRQSRPGIHKHDDPPCLQNSITALGTSLPKLQWCHQEEDIRHLWLQEVLHHHTQG